MDAIACTEGAITGRGFVVGLFSLLVFAEGAELTGEVSFGDQPANASPFAALVPAFAQGDALHGAAVNSADKPIDVNYRLWIQPGEMTVDEVAAHARNTSSSR